MSIHHDPPIPTTPTDANANPATDPTAEGQPPVQPITVEREASQLADVQEARPVYAVQTEAILGESPSPSNLLVQPDLSEPPNTMVESKTIRLSRVAERASVCVMCDLARTRSHVVFGDGSAEAPLMIIGEGPGQNEDATGKPFVGRAGALLDQCLRENGITRKHVYITNVVRCRPTLIEARRINNRPPTQEETLACSTWLQQTIDIVQPLVILCLGAPAANAIIHKGFKITQERGQWFESRFARYAMAAWHPAYILRLEGEAYDAARRALVSDIAAARQKVIEAKREPKMTLF